MMESRFKLHYSFYLLFLLVWMQGCERSEQMPEEEIEEEINPLTFDATPGERPIDTNPSEWVLDENLSDQFENGTVPGSNWENDVNDWGPWSWEPNNAYQEGGKLHLRMRYEEHTARGMDMYYKSGIVRSRDTITYGYVEVKMKGIPLYPAASPAFWLYSIGSELDQWGLRGTKEGDVRYNEIDVVELTQGNWNPETNDRFPPELMDCNLHVTIREGGQDVRKWPQQFPDILKTEYTAPWDPRNDFHTYGAEISPDKIVFYIDGKKISEKDNLYWRLPMHVTISLGLRYPHVTWNNCPNGLARCPVPEAATEEGFPTTMQVDWVRCYRKNQ